ncbi:MAG: UvrD-helicase domain-containing protein [Clostridiales bacterium]|jgi:ATP-dependent helicase/nuclease subunit A|nr:UvrD-helicase domain-containing protein [Clostridiales bacterium]
MVTRFTDKQRQVISGTGGMLVSASAGSGKTTTMIERAAQRLTAGGELSETVICTFTRAAAADMKDKLYQKLFTIYKERGGEDLERQLNALSTAEISTIDSWCQRLIRSYFYALDVDPGFEVMDEGEADVLLSEAVEGAIAQYLEAADADFLFLYDALLWRRRHTGLARILLRVYQFAATQPDPQAWLRGDALAVYADPARADAVLRGEEERLSALAGGKLTELLARCRAVGYSRNDDAIEEVLTRVGDKNDLLDGLPVGRGPVGDFPALNDAFKALKDKLLPRLSRARGDLLLPDGTESSVYAGTLCAVTRTVFELYREAKRRRNKLDYADLEHYARELLQIPDVAADIAGRYRAVFVDEYQDINPLQDSIISAVSKQSEVLLVGDVKQSIYAFRRCDPQIFIDKYYGYKALGLQPPIELNHNFRSRAEILSFCNEVFSRCMTRDFGGIDYASDARLIGRAGFSGGVVEAVILQKAAERPKPTPAVYSVLSHDETDSGADTGLLNDRIVLDIVELLESGLVEEDGEKRRVRPSDIAVLTRSAGGEAADLYERLRVAGVNVYMKKPLNFSSVYEIAVLLAFLRLIDNHTDDIALVSVLQSFFVGLDKNGLAEIRLSERPQAGDARQGSRPAEEEPGRFFRAAKAYAADKTDDTAVRLNAFFAELDFYTAYAAGHTAGELIGRFIAAHGYFAHVLAQDGGAEKAELLSAFLEHINRAPYGRTTADYVVYLRNAQPAHTPDAPAGAVRLMTVHAAKGLEFEHVFLIHTQKKFNLSDERASAILEPRLGLCLKTWDKTRRAVLPNRIHRAAAVKLTAAQKEEEMRLLYVALTRAKTGLRLYAVLPEKDPLFTGDPCPPARDAECFFDWLMPAAREKGFSLIDRAAQPTIDYAPQDRTLSGREDPALTASLRAQFSFVYPHAPRPVKTSVTALLADEAAADLPRAGYAAGGETDDRAAARGTAYHRVMERLDFAKPFERAFSDAVGGLAEGEAASVDKGEIATAHRVIGRLVKNRTYFREIPFILSEGGRLIQGIIDLLIADEKSCTVIDYKTAKADTITAGHFDAQLGMYGRAARKILKKEPEKLYVYAFGTGKLYEVPGVGKS